MNSINKIIEYLREYVLQYSFFVDENYYVNLYNRYFTVTGFIIGLIFVLLVFFASAGEKKKTGVFRTLPMVALINSLYVISSFFDKTFHQGLSFNSVFSFLNAPDNILSGFVLTLVVFSCYKKYPGRAFLFGLTTHLALPLLNYYYISRIIEDTVVIYLFLRIVLAGFVCLIISHRKHFYTSWIWYTGFHLFMRACAYFLPLLSAIIESDSSIINTYSINNALTYFSQYTADILFSLVILIFAIIFEKSVITIKTTPKAKSKGAI